MIPLLKTFEKSKFGWKLKKEKMWQIIIVRPILYYSNNVEKLVIDNFFFWNKRIGIFKLTIEGKLFSNSGCDIGPESCIIFQDTATVKAKLRILEIHF